MAAVDPTTAAVALFGPDVKLIVLDGGARAEVWHAGELEGVYTEPLEARRAAERLEAAAG